MAVFPNWLYEPLPYIYGVAGIASTFTLDTLVGRMSGILLITAGIVVAFQRYEYRRVKKQRQERLEWLSRQSQMRKKERQEWLRKQADDLREKIEHKKNDF
jgi:hypothetical protein